MWKCDRRIWRGKGGKLYEDGDPRSQVLVATAGDELPSKPNVEKALRPAEDKSLKPSENKSADPTRSNRSGAQSSREAPEPFPQLEEEDGEQES